MKATKVKACRKPIALAMSALMLVSAGFGTALSAQAAANPNFETTTADAAESKEKALELNTKLAEEGFVLLKNGDVSVGESTAPALPFASGRSVGISVFGKNSVNPIIGGSGSSSGNVAMDQLATQISDSLTSAGYQVNGALHDFYMNTGEEGVGSGPQRVSNPASGGSIVSGFPTGETPQSYYTAYDEANENALTNSYAQYEDAAVVVFSRIGGEGMDTPTTSVRGGNSNSGPAASGVECIAGRSDPSQHYLELDDNERALLKMIHDSQAFTRTIVVINAGEPLECDFLYDEEYGVDACVWVGSTGDNGFEVLGRIFNGDVNPSGRLTATYATDFLATPAVQNFASNAYVDENGVVHGYGYDYTAELGENGNYPTAPMGNEYRDSLGNRFSTRTYESSYEEGIYVGYRYYETRGYEDGEAWYDENVVFPFGYGLSYTDFNWSLNAGKSIANNTVLTEDGKVEISIDVENTGSASGKDVVELYYSAPYTEGGIEKSHVVLGAFAKTSELAPGRAETVTLSFDVRDMASYDYNDANNNGFTGYELEGGTYTVYIGTDAHCWADENVIELTFTVPSGGFTYETDAETGYTVENRFDYASDKMSQYNTVMSRSDFAGTFPTRPTAQELVRSAEYISGLNTASGGGWTGGTSTIGPEYDAGKPWETDVMPTQAQEVVTADDEDRILYSDLNGKDYDDPLWDEFLNQFTVDQLVYLVGSSAYRLKTISALGIPLAYVPDGPMGIIDNFVCGMLGLPNGTTDSCFYVASCVVASTWNVELLKEQGEAIGEEALQNGVSGIYAPAVNIWRTPFSGRNFEYYSEDGFLSGALVSAYCQGAQSKGLITFVKHFVLNDQETNRDSNALCTWADEQTMREIYFKSFQMAVQEGGTRGIMSSYNRIGDVWTGASYDLLTEVLRNEWGFEGCVVTDWVTDGNAYDVNAGIRAGNDWVLNPWGFNPMNSETANTPTHVAALRKSVKNILYAFAQSNIMPQYQGVESAVVYAGANNRINVSSTAMSVPTNHDGTVRMATLTYGLKGELPLGMRLNSATGEIIGSPASTGTYEAVVELYLDDVLMQRTPVTITVAETTYAGTTLSQATAGSSYAGNVATAQNTAGDNVSYALKAGSELPEGLTLSSNGLLTGTPAEAGTYTFTVVASANGVADVETEFTLTVAPASTEIADLNGTVDSLKDTVDSLNETIDGLNDKIAELESRLDETSETGCGGAIYGFTGIALCALAAGALVLAVTKKRERDQEKRNK